MPGDGLELAEHLDEILREWPSACAFTARSVLQRFPQLQDNRSAVVAIAAEEYLRARRTNRRFDVSTFAAGFGELETSVLRAAEVMDFFLAAGDAEVHDASGVWPNAGEQFLHFDLVEQLGGGLLSRVFIARDNAVAQRHVIVKLTPSSDREIDALGRLAHPGIVPILSIETDPVTGLSAVVMPFQSRVTLHDIIVLLSGADGIGKRDIPVDRIDPEIRRRNAQQPCPPGFDDRSRHGPGRRWQSEWIAEVGAAIADALHAAHARGVLHCDVKPSNIVLINASRPMLVDFNLSVGQDVQRIAIGGTIPYMPPEQLCGAALDERADVFSLAATLYHALTGAPPFGGPGLSLSRALSARIAEPQRAAERLRSVSTVDAALAQVILDGLAFEPAARPVSAAEFAESLRRCLHGRSRLSRILRRRRREAFMGMSAAVLLLAGLGLWQFNRDPLEVRATRAAISEARRFNFDESIRLATTALKEDPDFRAALLIRAEAAIKCGDLRTAYVDLKRAADESAPADIRLLLTYLNYLLVRADDEAIVEMQMGLDSGLSEAQVRNNLGFCHLLREELQPAVAELHRATKLDPGFTPGWLNLAVADLRISLKKPEDRPHLDYIENAVALSPASLDIRRVAVDVYVRDVRAGGTTRDALERHCAAAIRHGVPLADIVKALAPLAEDLRDSILKDLSDAGETRDDQQVVHTMRFVSPCDVVAVATSLLEHCAD